MKSKQKFPGLIKEGLGVCLACLLLLSTFLNGLIAEAQAQTLAGQGRVSPSDVDQVIDDLEKWERSFLEAAFQTESEQEIVSPSVYNWPTIGLARLGRDEGLSVYLAENENYLQQNWNSVSRKVTDLARISLAVGAAQGNPQDYGGKDLIAEIYNFGNIEAQGINGPIFALIALDSGGYELPATARWTREKLLDIILSKQLADGGYSLDGTGSGDVDLTAMALQALAPYYRAGQPEVKAVVDKALAYLAQVQEGDGGFRSWGAKNSESVCQTIIALCAVGIDVDTDPHFIKNSNSLLDNLLEFRADDGGFKHVLEESTNNMASEQALLALAAYVRFQDGQPGLYDYQSEKQSSPQELLNEPAGASAPGLKRIAGADCYATAVLPWELEQRFMFWAVQPLFQTAYCRLLSR